MSALPQPPPVTAPSLGAGSQDAERRPFGLPSLSALVVANMVGAGVFTTSGFALADLGRPSFVLAAWAVGGGLALCGALSYGALARRMTESGGEYVFLARAVHPLAGFLAGWVSLLAGFTGALAFAAEALEVYAAPPGSALGALPSGTVATAALVVAGLLHGWRIRTGVLPQNVAVGVKLGLLLLFAVTAALSTPAWAGGPLPSSSGAPTAFSITAFAGSLVWISLSYSGFNAAVYVADEARDARRTVPRSMWTATLAVAALYLALNAVFVLAPSPDVVAGREDVAAAAAHFVGGDAFAVAVRALIALALWTSVSAMTLAGPRVYAKMAEDGLFPRALLPPLGSAGGPPRAAIALQVALAAIAVWISGIEGLLSYLGLTLWLSTAATVAVLFLLRRREGAEAVPVPGYPVVPAVYVGAVLVFAALAAFRAPTELAAAAVTLAFGTAVYFIFRRTPPT